MGATRKWAALLRGITPMNAKMSDLVRAFEAAGFDDVSTVTASGNVVFGARSSSPAALQRKAEKAMQEELGRSFLTIVRAIEGLRALLEANPWAGFRLPKGSKRVVTFLHAPTKARLKLPISRDGARILLATDTEVHTAYVPHPDGGGQFMRMIEDAYGQEITTRTWETVQKIVKRGS